MSDINSNSGQIIEETSPTTDQTSTTDSSYGDPLTQSIADGPLLTLLGTGNSDPMATLTMVSAGSTQEGVSGDGTEDQQVKPGTEERK